MSHSVVQECLPALRSNNGAVVGGFASGLLGSTIGRSTGCIAAAALDAGLGAIVDDRVDNQNAYPGTQSVAKPIQQCVTVDQSKTVTTGYLVNI